MYQKCNKNICRGYKESFGFDSNLILFLHSSQKSCAASGHQLFLAGPKGQSDIYCWPKEPSKDYQPPNQLAVKGLMCQYFLLYNLIEQLLDVD